MLKVEEVSDRKDATHIYVLETKTDIVEGIKGGNFYKLNKDKRTVIDSDGEKNLAWNMTDYVFVKTSELWD